MPPLLLSSHWIQCSSQVFLVPSSGTRASWKCDFVSQYLPSCHPRPNLPYRYLRYVLRVEVLARSRDSRTNQLLPYLATTIATANPRPSAIASCVIHSWRRFSFEFITRPSALMHGVLYLSCSPNQTNQVAWKPGASCLSSITLTSQHLCTSTSTSASSSITEHDNENRRIS